VRAAAERLGGLDLLVNAAGEGFAPLPFEDLEETDWDAAFGATAKGSFFVTQAAAPLLRESKGVVVMIEDVAAYQAWPSFAAHCAAKAAQAMLTRVFARALAPAEMKEALAQDKSRSQVFDISPLGLLEVTRKRVSGGLLEAFSETCPTCEGRGLLITYDVN
jgi:NADP-dependent 3-hydroxy acid dehydrogenase YdfG